MATVFLSYGRDDQLLARQIVSALEMGGCTVWWDGLLTGGERFAKTAAAELAKADVVVVLWSRHSVESHWVQDEASEGRDRGRLVPVTIDGTMAPLGFRQLQVLNLAQWKGQLDAPEIAALIRSIDSVAGTSEFPRTANATGRVTVHTTALNRRRLLVGGTAAIAAAGVAYTGWRRGWFTSAEVSPNSIAVLPFDNLSGDPAQDYFAEGLAEETRLALARNPLLKVIATTSSSMFRNSNESVLEIAAKLGVAIVLEGSVRRVDDLVRIAVKFIDGKTGASKWTQEFRGGFTDVFGLQDEVSGKVAESLTAQAGGEGMFTALTTAAESGATTSAPAFDALLKGRSEYSRAESAEGLQAAVGHFDAAIAIDGNYAAAHANRSKCLAELAGNFAELTDIPDLNREAIEAARRAVSLAPKYADGHSALAFALLHGNLSLADARASFEQSRALGEGNASTMLEFARFSALDGKPEQAAQASTRALLLDPVNARAHAAHCRVLYSSRNYAAAVAAARQTLAINPQAAGVYGFMGRSLMLMGDRKAGLEASKQETLDWCLATDLAIMNFLNGDKPAAERAFESLAALEQTHYQQAEVLAQWGDSSGALLHLDQAFAQGDVGTVELATDPLLDPLRNHHAWRDYEQRIGFRA